MINRESHRTLQDKDLVEDAGTFQVDQIIPAGELNIT